MSISKDEAHERANAAAARETLGAFVEIDNNKLSRQELVMLGVKMTLTKYRAAFEGIGRNHVNPIIGSLVMQMIAPMVEEEEAVTLELTRSARTHGAARVHELKAGKQ